MRSVIRSPNAFKKNKTILAIKCFNERNSIWQWNRAHILLCCSCISPRLALKVLRILCNRFANVEWGREMRKTAEISPDNLQESVLTQRHTEKKRKRKNHVHGRKAELIGLLPLSIIRTNSALGKLSANDILSVKTCNHPMASTSHTTAYPRQLLNFKINVRRSITHQIYYI